VNDEELIDKIAAFVASVPGDQVEIVGTKLGSIPAPSPAAVTALRSVIPTTRFQQHAKELGDAWMKTDLSGRSLAIALRASAISHEVRAEASSIEVVWTGPPGSLEVRLTSVVIGDVIAAAQARMTMVAFAAYKVKAISEALREASERGVEIRLVLDGGTDAKKAFDELDDVARIYTWPPTQLPQWNNERANMHAKVALADNTVAFVSSANLTGHAMDKNMELGLLVRGGSVPSDLAEHFDLLIASKTLVEVK